MIFLYDLLKLIGQSRRCVLYRVSMYERNKTEVISAVTVVCWGASRKYLDFSRASRILPRVWCIFTQKIHEKLWVIEVSCCAHGFSVLYGCFRTLECALGKPEKSKRCIEFCYTCICTANYVHYLIKRCFYCYTLFSWKFRRKCLFCHLHSRVVRTVRRQMIIYVKNER